MGLPATAAGDDWATLHFLDTGQSLPLAGSDEFTMGRSTERQPIPPDIDLSAYDAFSSGVSRRHATIRRRGSRVVLLDLDSANGTYVNGKRLGPRQEEPLANGDVIALGKLKIQVRLRTA
jgi:pSer/pThr/pTyr-binding forkhead associated (FHA) protein